MAHKQGLFLSHAWAEEGGDPAFVNRLHADLVRNGHDAWLDARNMPSRGRSLPQEVADQIDKSDRVIAIVGPEWLKSEPCQAERDYALRTGKVFTPILRVGDYKSLSPELTRFFVPDFRRDYESPLRDLLRVLKSPVAQPGRLLGVPALPPYYQPREDQLKDIRRALLTAKLDASVADPERHRAALHGMGGSGKSVLAAAYACDYDARRAFLDGIVWVKVGAKPNLLCLVQNASSALGGEHVGALTELDRAQQYLMQLLADKTCLLVLDDIWQLEPAEVFVNAMGLKCRLLLTTRDAGLANRLGADLIVVGTLDDKAACAMLAEWAGPSRGKLSADMRAVAEECGKLPLALAQCGALARAGTSWTDLFDALRHADLSFMTERPPNYDYDNVFRAIQASMEALAATDPNAADRYRELAVFPAGAAISEGAVATLWVAGGMLERNARQLVTTLSSRAMIERVEGESPDRRFWLHDLYCDYLRAVQRDLLPLHERLLQAYRAKCPNGWHTGPDDGYFFEHLADHMRAAGWTDQLQSLLLDFDWLQAKLDVTHITALLVELEKSAGFPNVGLVRNAVRLSAHVLAADTSQLAGQLIGRLLGDESPPIAAMLAQATRWRARPWLRPLTASLTHPRGPLMWTFTQGDDVKDVAVIAAPGGAGWWAVSITFHGLTKVWDVVNGVEVCGTPLEGLEIGALAATSDGTRLVFSSDMHAVRIWDPGRGPELGTVEGTCADQLAITPDGKQVVCADYRSLTLWDVETGRMLWTIEVDDVSRKVAITPDGKQLLGGSRNVFKVWDLATGQEKWSLAGHERNVNAAIGVQQGERRLAVSASDDMTLKVWDLATGKELRTLREHRNIVFTLAGVPGQGGNAWRVVSASGDSTLKLWDPDSENAIETLDGHSSLAYALAVTPDGKRAVSGSYDHTVKVWDLENREGSQHGQGFWSVAVAPEGGHAVFGRWDGSLARWDLTNRSEVDSVTAQIGGVQFLAMSADGKRVVCATKSGILGAWDFVSPGFCVKAHDQVISALAMTPDGHRAVTCTWGNQVTLWSLADGKELLARQLDTRSISSAVVTPDGQRLVLSDYGALRVLDLDSLNEISRFPNRHLFALSLTITPDGKQVWAGFEHGRILMWDLENGQQISVLEAHHNSVNKLAITSDGKRFVSASSDGTVKLWDRESAKLMATYSADGAIQSLSITSDARTIVAVDALGRGHFLMLVEPGAALLQ